MELTLPEVSAELLVIPLDGAYLVYAPLRQAAFVANAEVVNKIAALKEGSCDLSQAGTSELVDFLRQLQIVDGGNETLPLSEFRGNPKPTTLTLFLTTACNLRCTYCYASAGDTPQRVMSFEVARNGIDFVIANALELKEPGIEIAYHGGGEPSSNWDTLTRSYEYALERTSRVSLQLRAAMATNGVISDEKIDWIVNHLDGVSLSFDGLPEAHDTNRMTLSGRGSSQSVIHTITRFDRAGFNYGIRVTVTHDQVKNLEASIRFICENFKPRRIQVEPAYQLGRWRDAPSAETVEFVDCYRKAQQVANSLGNDIEFSGARLGLLSNHFCGVTQDSFCLTADGAVSACYEVFLESSKWSDTFHYGRFDDKEQKYEFQLPVLENLRSQSVDRREFCQGCFAKWSCGGDCLHKAYETTGSTEFVGTERCHIIRELTKDQILDRIRKSNGIFWHEPDSSVMPPSGKEFLL